MPTISLREIEVVLLVSQQLVCLSIHGEESEGWVDVAIRCDRRGNHHGTVDSISVLSLRCFRTNMQVILLP